MTWAINESKTLAELKKNATKTTKNYCPECSQGFWRTIKKEKQTPCFFGLFTKTVIEEKEIYVRGKKYVGYEDSSGTYCGKCGHILGIKLVKE